MRWRSTTQRALVSAFGIAALSLGLASVPAAHAATAAHATAPKPAFLTGGISAEEETHMKHIAGQWPLRMIFSERKDNEFVAGVKLKVVNAQDKSVLAFADRMLTDHGQANEELKQVATKLGWTLPSDMGPDNRETYANLKKLSGQRFDAAYKLAMVSDHSKDVAAFQQQAQFGKTPELKAFAKKTLPTLQEHLKMAQALPGAE